MYVQLQQIWVVTPQIRSPKKELGKLPSSTILVFWVLNLDTRILTGYDQTHSEEQIQPSQVRRDIETNATFQSPVSYPTSPTALFRSLLSVANPARRQENCFPL